MEDGATAFDGGCTCRTVRYRMTSRPLFVNCCHCTWCQRETGSAFAINAMIEADRVVLLRGEVDVVDTPSASGKGQRIARCPHCRVAVWSNYGGSGDVVRFVRVARSTSPTGCRPTSTSSPLPSSAGSCCRPGPRRSPSTTRPPSCGRRRASSGARRSSPARRRSRRDVWRAPCYVASRAQRRIRAPSLPAVLE